MSANKATVPLPKCLICERPVELVPGTDDCWRHADGARTHHIVSPAAIHPLWKGIAMKPGYAICKNCEYPIRPAPDGRGKHVWVHIEALPRCSDPLPMRQAELERIIEPHGWGGLTDFAHRFSAEVAGGLFIDEPKPPKPDDLSVPAKDEITGIRLLLDQMDRNGNRSALPIQPPGGCVICNRGITTFDSYGVYPGGRMHWNCLREEAEKVSTPPTPWYKSRWYWITTIGYALLVKFSPQIKHLLLG